MHRFYMSHSFTKFNQFEIGITCVFLASKLDEQFRTLVDICRFGREILSTFPAADSSVSGADIFQRSTGMNKRRLLEVPLLELEERVIESETFILATLGFDLNLDHAHAWVIRGCTMLNVPPEVGKKAYCLASQSLMDTRMCLRHRASFVGCVCIIAAAKLCNVSLPEGNSDQAWWMSLDPTLARKELEEVTNNFMQIQKFKKSQQQDLQDGNKSIKISSIGHIPDALVSSTTESDRAQDSS
jgi:hypothetical protein